MARDPWVIIATAAGIMIVGYLAYQFLFAPRYGKLWARKHAEAAPLRAAAAPSEGSDCGGEGAPAAESEDDDAQAGFVAYEQDAAAAPAAALLDPGPHLVPDGSFGLARMGDRPQVRPARTGGEARPDPVMEAPRMGVGSSFRDAFPGYAVAPSTVRDAELQSERVGRPGAPGLGAAYDPVAARDPRLGGPEPNRMPLFEPRMLESNAAASLSVQNRLPVPPSQTVRRADEAFDRGDRPEAPGTAPRPVVRPGTHDRPGVGRSHLRAVAERPPEPQLPAGGLFEQAVDTSAVPLRSLPLREAGPGLPPNAPAAAPPGPGDDTALRRADRILVPDLSRLSADPMPIRPTATEAAGAFGLAARDLDPAAPPRVAPLPEMRPSQLETVMTLPVVEPRPSRLVEEGIDPTERLVPDTGALAAAVPEAPSHTRSSARRLRNAAVREPVGMPDEGAPALEPPAVRPARMRRGQAVRELVPDTLEHTG